jgi:hypothetical protein
LLRQGTAGKAPGHKERGGGRFRKNVPMNLSIVQFHSPHLEFSSL